MTQAPPRQLQTENRVPDCVFMKLHPAPVQSAASPLGFQVAESPPVPSTDQIDLKLTIRFNKVTMKYPGGTIEFGLKRGEFTLQLENGRIPLEKVALKAEFAKALEVEEQSEKGRGSELSLSGGSGMMPSMGANFKMADTDKVAHKTKQIVPQITNRGTEEQPVWEFKVQAGSKDLILLGQLTEEAIGTLEVTKTPCSCTATFTIRNQSDLHLFDASGLISGKNLSRNKLAWIERELFLRFIAPKLQPHLSRVEGQL